MKKKLAYFRQNWKLIFHLLFRTYRFGVNNQWWSDFDSIFGKPLYTRLNPWQLYDNVKMMEFRVKACKFIDNKDAKILFGGKDPQSRFVQEEEV